MSNKQKLVTNLQDKFKKVKLKSNEQKQVKGGIIGASDIDFA